MTLGVIGHKSRVSTLTYVGIGVVFTIQDGNPE